MKKRTIFITILFMLMAIGLAYKINNWGSSKKPSSISIKNTQCNPNETSTDSGFRTISTYKKLLINKDFNEAKKYMTDKYADGDLGTSKEKVIELFQNRPDFVDDIVETINSGCKIIEPALIQCPQSADPNFVVLFQLDHTSCIWHMSFFGND